MRSPKEKKVVIIVILILALITFVMNLISFGFGVALCYFVGSLGIISAILFANDDESRAKKDALNDKHLRKAKNIDELKHDLNDEKSDQK